MKTKLLPIMFLFFSVHAFSQSVAPSIVPDRIADNAGLLNASEKEDLASLMYRIAATYNFELVIVTEKNIGDASPRAYADNFFDNSVGGARDGCLFLQVTESQDFYFSTSGRGGDVLNPYAFKKLESDTVKHLVEDNSYAAFLAFIQCWDKFLLLEAKGRSYNFIYRWNVVLVIIAWLTALAIACLIVGTWKGGMNTAMPQTMAAVYTVPGSLNFTAKKDSFLHRTVSKTKLQTQSSVPASGLRASSPGGNYGGGGKYRSKK
jgi:uncharacterized membrane protein YgcG